MSTIYAYGEKEVPPKLIRFVILLSSLKREQALRMLPDFNRESYYNDLDRLLEQVGLVGSLQSEVFRERQINMQLKAEATRLNNRLAQESLRQRPATMTDQQQQIIEVATYMLANDLARAQIVSKRYKMNQLSGIIQELQEYRWLKEYIYSTPGSRNSDSIRFDTLPGENLRQLVVDQSSRFNEAMTFFKSQFHKITENLDLSTIPPRLFDEDFKRCYETFVSKLREMKNNLHDLQRPLKEKLVTFSKRHHIQIDQSADSSQCIDHLFNALESILEKPKQQKIFYKRSISSVSDIFLSDGESSISVNNQPSTIMFQKKFERKRVRNSNSNNQPELKLDELYKILIMHLPEIPNYTQLAADRKMEELVKKVRELAGEVERIKSNDEQFIKSFIMTDNIPRQPKDGNSLIEEEEIPPALSNHQSTDSPSLSQLKTLSDRLARELEEEREKAVKTDEYISRLVVKLKGYTARENQTIIDHKGGLQKRRQATVAALQEEVEAMKEMINKLKQDLGEKATIINSFEISRTEERKRFEKEKQKLLDTEKARFNKMRDDYDYLMEQLNNIGSLYEERFLIPQKPTPQTPREATNEEWNRLRQELQVLSAENQALKQQVNRTTQQMGVSIRQNSSLDMSPENSQQNDSFIQKLGLESKIIPPSQTRLLYDKISELEFKNEYLSIEIEKKDTFYNAILDSQTRECSELKEVAATLSTEREELSSRLRLLQIRSVTHNQQNLPTLHLFPPGGIFEDHDYQERLFLLENLQSYTGTIRSTRLIYRADPHNRANFHKYIDKQRNVVAIFKTIYGRLIAGYSEQAFDAGGIVRGHGMIFSLWGRKVFELREKRAISYDDYFLIFGNSELRIKTNEFRLFSNFGIANSYYNNRGEKVHAMLGEDKEREVDLSHFEVYALDLEQ